MLGITRYRFNLRAIDPIRFTSFPGSAIRGVFGHSLKKTVCVTRLDRCDSCALRRDCVHSYLFETPVTLDSGQDAPHPLIFDVRGVARDISPGDSFAVEATLIGESERHLPYMVEAWRRAGQRGLGRQQARFELRSVAGRDFPGGVWLPVLEDGERVAPPPRPFDFSENPGPVPARIRLELLTPYRGKREGRLVTPDSFSASGFVTSLIRRIDRLGKLHDPARDWDAHEMIQAAMGVTMTDPDLRWSDWVRYSTRQRTRMKLGGVVGALFLEGEGLATVWPALQVGQWIQAGKSTLFGLGCYRITPTSGDEAGNHG